MVRFAKRLGLLLMALILALSFISCDNGDKKTLNTDNLRKFVEKQKNSGKMDYDKTKKAYKSVFPNMKMD